MYKYFSTVIFLTGALLVLTCCKKGERIEVQQYMKFRLQAFYPDTSLYYQVRLNDSVLADYSGITGGSIINFINGRKEQLPGLDSARLKVTVIKKNNINVTVDSVIYLTNDNDFLLLQLDPKQTPTLINKKLATVTEKRAGTDSLKVRFFYNGDDDIRRNGTLLKSIDLQLYSYSYDSLGYPDEPPLRDEGRIRGIKSGELSAYYSVRYQADNRPRGFVAEVYPPGSSASTKPQYPREYDEIDGFIGGSLPVDKNKGHFLTFRITKSAQYPQYRNCLFLFGFQ